MVVPAVPLLDQTRAGADDAPLDHRHGSNKYADHRAGHLLGAMRSLGSTISELPLALHGGLPLKIALTDQGVILRTLSTQLERREAHRDGVALAAMELQNNKEARLIETLALRDAKLQSQHQSRRDDVAEMGAIRRSAYEARWAAAAKVRSHSAAAVGHNQRRKRNGHNKDDRSHDGGPSTMHVEEHHETTNEAVTATSHNKGPPTRASQHPRRRSGSPTRCNASTYREEQARILKAIYNDTAHRGRWAAHTTIHGGEHNDHLTASSTAASRQSHSSGPFDLQAELRRAEEEHLHSQRREHTLESQRLRQRARQQELQQERQQMSSSQNFASRTATTLTVSSSAEEGGRRSGSASAMRRLAQPNVLPSHADRCAAFDQRHDAKAKKLEEAARESAEYHLAVAEHRHKHASTVDGRRAAQSESTLEAWKQRTSHLHNPHYDDSTRKPNATSSNPPQATCRHNGSIVWGRVAQHVHRARELQQGNEDRQRQILSSKAGERWLRQLK